MPTWKTHLEYWTETKFVIGGEVDSVTCCCADPGGTSRTCRAWSGNKTYCRCHCHRLRRAYDKEQAVLAKTPTP